jgi:hypothetical protein
MLTQVNVFKQDQDVGGYVAIHKKFEIFESLMCLPSLPQRQNTVSVNNGMLCRLSTRSSSFMIQVRNIDMYNFFLKRKNSFFLFSKLGMPILK